ncbi:MAG TPA: oligosaccharide flippase family protein [Geminicoccaceae bacterium]
MTTRGTTPAGAPAQRLGRRALDGMLWTFSGAAAKGLIQILVLMLLARLLDPGAFGVVAAALLVVRLAASISTAGIGAAIIQKQDLQPEDVSSAFAFFLLAGAAASLGIALAAPALAALFRMPPLELVLVILAPAILLEGAGELASMLLRRRLCFRHIAGAALVSYVLGYCVVGVALAVLGLGFWALVAAHLAQTTIRTVLLLLLEPHAKSVRISLPALGRLVRFGGGLVFWRLANACAVELDKFVVGRWLGAEALGLYERAHHLAVAPAAFLGQGVLMVLFPVMSKIQDDKERLAASYRRGVTLANLVTAPASAVIAVMAVEIVAVLLGAQWHAAALPLAVLALGLLFRINSRVAGSIAVATAAVYPMAWRQGAYAVLTLVGALVGQLWGLAGVAAGIVLSQLVHYLLMAQLARSCSAIRLRHLLLAHAPGFALAGLVVPPVWLVRLAMTDLGFGPLAVLGGGAATCALVLLVLLHTAPRLMLGADGVWVLEALLERVPKRNRTTLRRVLGLRVVRPAA